MPVPAITVLLPVYNAQSYLYEAIKSLLHQTFKNFELLIINDGSTDDTEAIIKSIFDDRIVYIKNKTNLGLVATLNKGIDAATGKYIARMDADDTCKENRLELQVNFLEKNKKIAVVASNIFFINEANIVTGEWKEDLKTVIHTEIKEKMIWENCIAHPTVMVRSEVLKKYKYLPNQKNAEDYDLWLRLLADGYLFEKIPEKLLLYRVHSMSITGSILKKSNPYYNQFKCKRQFLQGRIASGKWGKFESKVVLSTVHNGIMGIGKSLKSLIQN